MEEPKTVTNAALDKLPLFASDMEIAAAIVGRGRAEYWCRAILPALEQRGFPAIDPLHKARPVPLVKQYFAIYFGIAAGFTLAKPPGEEKVWIPKRQRKAMEEERRANVSRPTSARGEAPPNRPADHGEG